MPTAPWAPYSPAFLASRLTAVTAPWYIAAGWAIELFLDDRLQQREPTLTAAPIVQPGGPTLTATAIVQPGGPKPSADPIGQLGGPMPTADAIVRPGGPMPTADAIVRPGWPTLTADAIVQQGGPMPTADPIGQLGVRTVAARTHEDIEFAVPAGRFSEVAECFPEVDFYVPHDGELFPASAERLAADFQSWALERSTNLWRFDVFREPHEGDLWHCRRDPRIQLPYPEIILRNADGIPYLRPEIVLLFKAKGLRDKDQADFAHCLPHLTDAQKTWLAGALTTVHPGHTWLTSL